MQTYVDLGETLIFVIMGFASVLALAVFVERLIVYRRTISEKSEHFLQNLTISLRKKDISEIKDLVSQSEDTVYSRFTSFTMERLEENPNGIPVLMEGKIISEKIELEKRLPILNTLGNNAPFIGLLGTVLGVIKAFYNLGTLGNTGAEVVMRSISTALLATAAGLAIAIPVVMINNFFSRKMKVILANLEILSREFTGNFLSGSKKQNH
ncbi:MAG: MotA/TolQ/ExbB proton channel family protein [Leptospiraceae bacterium]|nr:MotA/TolQ/ExbB proton channel family protein [Leptospiraceae bacterium]